MLELTILFIHVSTLLYNTYINTVFPVVPRRQRGLSHATISILFDANDVTLVQTYYGPALLPIIRLP